MDIQAFEHLSDQNWEYIKTKILNKAIEHTVSYSVISLQCSVFPRPVSSTNPIFFGPLCLNVDL